MDYDQKLINYNDFLREIDNSNDYGQYPMGPPSPNSAPMGFLDTPAFDSGNMANFSQTNNQQFEFNISTPTALSSNQVPIFLQPKQEPGLSGGLFNFPTASSSPYNTPLTSNPSSPMITDAHPLHGFGDSLSHSQQFNVETPEGIKIAAQPKKYQVVNYNIYPALEIEFEKTSLEPITIQAFLVYDNTIEVPEGFTNGDVQVLKVGQNRVSFPALHLNRMTPIKNTVQQSGAAPGANFSIKFKIGNTFFFSNPFKLVSAVNQIPNEEATEPMRPRKSKSEKGGKEHMEVSQPKASKVSSSGKRRATEQMVHEDDLFLHVKVRGDDQPRGFITLPKTATLRSARDEIGKSPNYPKSYRFWFERMQTIVQPHQEDSIRAGEAVDKTCLILEPYDAALHSVDDEVLSLWLSKKDKDPLVPIVEVIKTLFAVYKPTTQDIQELNIINGGVSHFLANISKNRQQSGKVSMEDFKLFLKFFGPARECLNKVLNVYKEPYFHGFARHSDAVKLLNGKPGSFLVRYSESQLKDGFFAFNVNKGTHEENSTESSGMSTTDSRDVIENYSLRYDADIQAFIFRGKRYRTLHDFVADSEYSKILKRGLPKTTTETIKESKYEDETHFLSPGAPADFRMLDG